MTNLDSILEKAVATHSSTLAWKIPWIEEPGRLKSMGSLTVGHFKDRASIGMRFLNNELPRVTGHGLYRADGRKDVEEGGDAKEEHVLHSGEGGEPVKGFEGGHIQNTDGSFVTDEERKQ